MALVVKDRVKETTATTGTGTLTLAGAVAGFQTFTSVLSNGDTTYYGIFESTTGEFEVGLGTFTSSGTTLARTTILESSNSGNAVNLTAGAADVFITQPAEKAVYLDGSGHIATADGRNVTNVAASTAGTVTTAAQPNITSLGTLTTLTVDDITINGSTISDGGDLTLDAAGEIVLDADGGDIIFKDGGTQFGVIFQSSNHMYIQSSISNGDIIFRGNDDGTAGTEALKLDMSDAGAATFNSTVTANAGINVDNININGTQIYLSSGDFTINSAAGDIILDADGGDIIFKDAGNSKLFISNSSDDVVFTNATTDKDIVFKGYDGASLIEAMRIDMSAAGAATFNAGITTTGIITGGSYNVGGTAVIDASRNLVNMGNVNGAAGFFGVLTVDDITINDSTISDGGDFTVDVGGNIHLDADGGYITFKDAGTQFGTVVNSSTNAEFQATLNVHLRPNNGTNASTNYVWNQGHVSPWSDNYYDLGNSSYGWKDGYFTGNIIVGSNIQHYGDSDTMLQFSAANTIRLVAGNTETFKTTNTAIDVSVPIYNYLAYFDESTSVSGTTPTVNAGSSGAFYLTMSGDTTFTFTNTTSGWAVGFVLYLTGNGSTVAWNGGGTTVRWAGGTAPDAPGNGETDVYVFHTRDGSTWYGALAIDAAS